MQWRGDAAKAQGNGCKGQANRKPSFQDGMPPPASTVRPVNDAIGTCQAMWETEADRYPKRNCGPVMPTVVSFEM
jgi:hypothetical protein